LGRTRQLFSEDNPVPDPHAEDAAIAFTEHRHADEGRQPFGLFALQTERQRLVQHGGEIRPLDLQLPEGRERTAAHAVAAVGSLVVAAQKHDVGAIHMEVQFGAGRVPSAGGAPVVDAGIADGPR
jgi:hypothetical protein